jgi:hypothetical protein
MLGQQRMAEPVMIDLEHQVFAREPVEHRSQSRLWKTLELEQRQRAAADAIGERCFGDAIKNDGQQLQDSLLQGRQRRMGVEQLLAKHGMIGG